MFPNTPQAGYQTADAELLEIAGLADTDGNFIVGNGTAWVAENGITVRASLGLGSAAVEATSAFQAADASLTSLAGLGTAADKYAYTTALDTWAEGTITPFGRSLLDDSSASDARTTVELSSVNNVQFAQLGVNTSDITTALIHASGTHPNTATVTYGVYSNFVTPATTTLLTAALYGAVELNADTFTCSNGIGFYLDAPVVGTGATLVNAYGIYIKAQTGATTNNIGARFDASDTMTMWLGAEADNTTANAGIGFGASLDTNLYRSAANTLKTDDTFIAAAGLQVGNSGTMLFPDGDGSHSFSLAANATTTETVAYTWPAASGNAGDVLTSAAGDGVLSWAAVSASGGASALDDLSDVAHVSGVSGNLFIGHEGSALTTGTRNYTVGSSAGNLITGGSSNICIGYTAGDAITSGSNNIAIGDQALSSLASSSGAVAIGHEALRDNLSGFSTAIGYTCLANATGQFNTAVGFFAGDFSGFTGGSNTLIGAYTDPDTSAREDVVCIGYGMTPSAENGAIAIGSYHVPANVLRVTAGELTIGGAGIVKTVTAGITASTTQTQGQQALTKQVNEVSVVANPNDTVTLPSAAVGTVCTVINNGASTLQIFPASGDNLGAGVDTSTTLAAGSNITYVAYDATNWEPI